MKSCFNLLRLFTFVIVLVLAAGCATTKHTESMLSAAGFKVVKVGTPQQEQKLKSLPPGKITTVQRNGKTYYVFPDVPHDRIYLGTLMEYQNYQQMVLDSKIAAQDRVAADMAPVDGADWADWDSWEVITWSPN